MTQPAIFDATATATAEEVFAEPQQQPHRSRPTVEDTVAPIDQIASVQPTALEAVERAAIDMQIATAKKYPRRSLVRIRDDIINRATIDKETAQSCFYTLKRDGKTIQGKSIGLARIALACYGNLRIAARIIGEEEKFVVAQGVSLDLEMNNGVSVDVRRRITRTDGRRYGDDMIATTSAAAVSIALRNAVFNVIPDAVVKPAYEACRQVMVGGAKSVDQKFAELVAVFKGKFKIEADRLVEWCQKEDAESLTWEDIKDLIGLHNALRDGEAKLEDVFPNAPKRAAFKRDKAPAPAVQQQAPAPPTEKSDGGDK